MIFGWETPIEHYIGFRDNSPYYISQVLAGKIIVSQEKMFFHKLLLPAISHSPYPPLYYDLLITRYMSLSLLPNQNHNVFITCYITRSLIPPIPQSPYSPLYHNLSFARYITISLLPTISQSPYDPPCHIGKLPQGQKILDKLKHKLLHCKLVFIMIQISRTTHRTVYMTYKQ